MRDEGTGAVQLYEVALVEGETSRDLMDRARDLGMGRLSATSELSEDQIRRLCPQRAARIEAALAPSVPLPVVTLDDPRTRHRHPQMGRVAAVIVAALVVTALGMAVATGGWGNGEALRHTSSSRAEAPVVDTAAAPAAPDATAEGSTTPLALVDPAAFCAGWPIVAEHWAGVAAVLATATGSDAVTSWAEEHHRGAAMAIRDHVVPAFGPDGAPVAVQDVLRWVFDTAFPPSGWDLAQVRLVTDAVAPAVAALQAQADTAC